MLSLADGFEDGSDEEDGGNNYESYDLPCKVLSQILQLKDARKSTQGTALTFEYELSCKKGSFSDSPAQRGREVQLKELPVFFNMRLIGPLILIFSYGHAHNEWMFILGRPFLKLILVFSYGHGHAHKQS